MNGDKINRVVAEAVRILRDYPELKCGQAIAKAKEVIKSEIDYKRDTTVKQ